MKKPNNDITEAQIRAALQSFKLAGGQIEHVPDEPTPRQSRVRSRWDSLASLSEAPRVPAPAVAEVAGFSRE